MIHARKAQYFIDVIEDGFLKLHTILKIEPIRFVFRLKNAKNSFIFFTKTLRTIFLSHLLVSLNLFVAVIITIISDNYCDAARW